MKDNCDLCGKAMGDSYFWIDTSEEPPVTRDICHECRHKIKYGGKK